MAARARVNKPSDTVGTTAAIAVRPQYGPQELFLSSPADIGIIGGSVFGGKTWSLVVEPLRHHNVANFNAVMFRREMPDATSPGGLWDETTKWYYAFGGRPTTQVREWHFPSKARIKIASLPQEASVEEWKGAQIALLIFDQLETFTERQFFYMLSRNRSTCGVSPYTRGSCNPDPDSFLVHFLEWWIDEEGWAIPERSGVIRWFIRHDDTVRWSTVGCAPSEYPQYAQRKALAIADLVAQGFNPDDAKDALSVTFVLARLQDNKIGTEIDPTYEAKVKSLSSVDRQRLLGGDRGGNWKVRPAAGKVFNRGWFDVVDAAPVEAKRVRYWDKAASDGKGDHSAGTKVACANAVYYIEDVVRGQWSSGARNKIIKETAISDGLETAVWVEQEPGSGGKESAEISIKELAGFVIHAEKVSGSKLSRAKAFAAQAEAGNVKLVRGRWNKEFLDELHAFDGRDGGQDDQVDTASGAFNKIALQGRVEFIDTTPTETDQDREAAQAEAERLAAEAKREAEEAVTNAISEAGVFWPGGHQ